MNDQERTSVSYPHHWTTVASTLAQSEAYSLISTVRVVCILVTMIDRIAQDQLATLLLPSGGKRENSKTIKPSSATPALQTNTR